MIDSVLSETSRLGFDRERTESGWSLKLGGHAILHLQFGDVKDRGVVVQLRWMKGWADPELLREFRERLDPLLSTREPEFPSIGLDRLDDASQLARFREVLEWLVDRYPGPIARGSA